MFLLVQGEAAIITKRLRRVDGVLPNGLVWQNLGQASRIYSRDSVDCSTSRMRFVKPSISYILLSALLCVCTVVKQPAEAELRWQDGKKEPIRVRIVAMAWNHPRSSFFSNEEIFVAEKALNQSESRLVKLVYGYLPYQPRLSDGGLDYATVHESRALRDPECDETLAQMTSPHGPRSSLKYSTDSPILNVERRRAPLPCYLTTADDYGKALREPVND